MWKNSLKNVESDNNKILYETVLDFFLQRNGTYFQNKPRIKYIRHFISKIFTSEICGTETLQKGMNQTRRRALGAEYSFIPAMLQV